MTDKQCDFNYTDDEHRPHHWTEATPESGPWETLWCHGKASTVQRNAIITEVAAELERAGQLQAAAFVQRLGAGK